MIHIARRPSAVDVVNELPSYKPRKQSATKYEGRYKGTVISDAVCERKEAIKHFTERTHFKVEKGRNKLTKDFKFKVYKQTDVVEALKTLFRKKCAYCEIKVGVGFDVEIEHFRPKKGFIDERTGKLQVPGYYWLGADWSNLFLSCQHCNQARSHEIPGEGRATVGKQSHFPIRDEEHRARRHKQDIADEETGRLLLNPCVDHPEKFLKFATADSDEKDGPKIGWVVEQQPGAAADAEIEGAHPDGYRSIRVFALQRPELVGARAEHALMLHLRITELIDAGNELQKARVDGDPKLQQLADKNFREAGLRLKEKLLPDAVFLGLTRQLIGEYGERGDFDRLKALKLDPMDLVRASVAETEGR